MYSIHFIRVIYSILGAVLGSRSYGLVELPTEEVSFMYTDYFTDIQMI